MRIYSNIWLISFNLSYTTKKFGFLFNYIVIQIDKFKHPNTKANSFINEILYYSGIILIYAMVTSFGDTADHIIIRNKIHFKFLHINSFK